MCGCDMDCTAICGCPCHDRSLGEVWDPYVGVDGGWREDGVPVNRSVRHLQAQIRELLVWAQVGADYLYDGPANGVPGYDRDNPDHCRLAFHVEASADHMRKRIYDGEFGGVA